MAQAQRIIWIDNVKGLILFFVLIFHAKFPWEIVRFVSYWFMPCFFLISGLLFRVKNNSIKETILHRTKTLLVPYFALSILFIFLNPNNYHGDILHAFKLNMWDVLMGNSGFMTVSLWFLYVLFEVCIATLLLHQMTLKLNSGIRNSIVIFVMIGCIFLDALSHNASLPFKLSDFFIAWLMFLLGYLLQPKIEDTPNIPIYWLILFATIASAFSFSLYGMKSPVDIYLSELQRIGVILSGSFSIISIVGIFTRIIPTNFIGFSLRYLANNAICFLATHMWVICLCRQYIPQYNPYIAAALGLALSLVLMPILNRYTPWLVGKKR